MPGISVLATVHLNDHSFVHGARLPTLAIRMHIMAQKPRRPLDPRDAAQALFAAPRKAAAPAVEKRAIPTTKELASLKIDSDVLGSKLIKEFLAQFFAHSPPSLMV